jgi:hypothetical protein
MKMIDDEIYLEIDDEIYENMKNMLKSKDSIDRELVGAFLKNINLKCKNTLKKCVKLIPLLYKKYKMENHVIDKEMVESLKQMILSPDENDTVLAMSIMLGFDTNDEFTVLSINELNGAILERSNSWSDFIRLKNKAYEIINDVKYKYNDFL